MKTRNLLKATIILQAIVIMYLVTSCTLSFTNISTHGTASDLLDEDQGASADVSPDIKIPAI